MCGAFHSAAVSLECQLFVWGRNDKGQLGRDPAQVPFSATPIIIDFGRAKVLEVQSGWTHFICRLGEQYLDEDHCQKFYHTLL